MANYIPKTIENQQNEVLIEQNISDKNEIMSFKEDTMPPNSALWLMKYRDLNGEFYSLRIERPGSDLNRGMAKIKKLDEEFFKIKTAKSRQNHIYKEIEVDQNQRKIEKERMDHEIYFYDPLQTIEDFGYGMVPISQGTVKEQIELKESFMELTQDKFGEVSLNEEETLPLVELRSDIEKLESYVRTGDKTLLGEYTYINPTLSDFQKANVKKYNLPQNKNLENFTQDYSNRHSKKVNNLLFQKNPKVR
ncbi:hypothetical protein LMK05_07225 [Lactococcus petauri]|nr:hypothetical protein LMK05_07225 [Lactococcus petauri]